MPRYFGRPPTVDGFREMPPADPPLGRSCIYCGDPIGTGDSGVIDDLGEVWHEDCWLLRVLRKLNPEAGIPEIGRQSLHQAAIETVRNFQREARL